MKEKKLMPRRRFEEFQNADAWERRMFSDVLDFSISNNTLSRADLNYDKGEVKNIHYGDILVKFDSIVDVNSDDVPWVTDGKPEDYKKQWLQNGDVIIADTAEDETTGKAIEITGITDNYAVSGLHTMVARPNQTFAPKYLGYYLNSPAYHNTLLPLMQGIKVLSLSKTNIAKTNVTFSKDVAEQEKIGLFFENLDNLITLHQRKLEKTKALKSAYLAEMFPAEGERVPKRRFAGFNDEWMQLKLNKVADYRSGKAHERNVVDNGKYIIVNSRFVSTNGRTKKFSNIQIEPLKKGELAFVLSDIPNGKALARAFLIDRDNLFTLNQRIAGITPKENTDSYFLKELMNRNEYFLKFDGGVGQTNLSNADIENFESSYPSFEEQKRIGNFFKQLEYKIMTQQQKLNKLKAMKQAYLEEMFV